MLSTGQGQQRSSYRVTGVDQKRDVKAKRRMSNTISSPQLTRIGKNTAPRNKFTNTLTSGDPMKVEGQHSGDKMTQRSTSRSQQRQKFAKEREFHGQNGFRQGQQTLKVGCYTDAVVGSVTSLTPTTPIGSPQLEQSRPWFRFTPPPPPPLPQQGEGHQGQDKGQHSFTPARAERPTLSHPGLGVYHLPLPPPSGIHPPSQPSQGQTQGQDLPPFPVVAAVADAVASSSPLTTFHPHNIEFYKFTVFGLEPGRELWGRRREQAILVAYFSHFGPVEEVVLRDSLAFVTMREREAADRILTLLHHTLWNGRVVECRQIFLSVDEFFQTLFFLELKFRPSSSEDGKAPTFGDLINSKWFNSVLCCTAAKAYVVQVGNGRGYDGPGLYRVPQQIDHILRKYWNDYQEAIKSVENSRPESAQSLD